MDERRRQRQQREFILGNDNLVEERHKAEKKNMNKSILLSRTKSSAIRNDVPNLVF